MTLQALWPPWLANVVLSVRTQGRTSHQAGRVPMRAEGILSQSLNHRADSCGFRWLYMLRLTIDANFHLSNKAWGIKSNPPLGDRWGHWVPEASYWAYLEKYGHQVEVCGSSPKMSHV